MMHNNDKSGAMEFKGLTTSHRTPNLTPLIDIVFLLLVFFLLTAHFVKDQSLNIDLPTADSATDMQENEALEILINSSGIIMIENQSVNQKNLNESLQKILASRVNKKVLLRGEKNSRLDLTVKVMDAARKAGAVSLDIVTRQP